MRRPLAIAVLCALALPHGALSDEAVDAAEGGRRIVSLNLCADELLMRLVPDEVASVTWFGKDPAASTVAAKAAAIPANHGLAEEAVAFDPDLVVAGRYTAQAAVSFLERIGVDVFVMDVPATLDEARRSILDLADRLGVPERGAALVREMDEAMAPLQADIGRPRALVLNPNGFTAGAHSIAGELIARAGLDNAAQDLGVSGYGAVPLETVILGDVDVLIVDAEPEALPSLATDILRHPALRDMQRRIVTARVPARLWTCAGPQMGDVVTILAEAARRARAMRAVR
ncbi:ABC transporter substrate-binding protein [Acuticoccus sediminis]|uniref:ABC transporter substrate-binding protein n=1 Tax=Acuticoccus sediminis TaxID=2184697 RepID=UPI001CFED70A|nr:ABC transporter substrate-binding protein [Acuticoccus sediminis]